MLEFSWRFFRRFGELRQYSILDRGGKGWGVLCARWWCFGLAGVMWARGRVARVGGCDTMRAGSLWGLDQDFSRERGVDQSMTTTTEPRSYKTVRDAPPVRHDGFDKVTGKASYGADVNLPGMLHAKVLRSPHAHAVIKSIDTSRAEAAPGVKAVITSADFPEYENKPCGWAVGRASAEHEPREREDTRAGTRFCGEGIRWRRWRRTVFTTRRRR